MPVVVEEMIEAYPEPDEQCTCIEAVLFYTDMIISTGTEYLITEVISFSLLLLLCSLYGEKTNIFFVIFFSMQGKTPDELNDAYNEGVAKTKKMLTDKKMSSDTVIKSIKKEVFTDAGAARFYFSDQFEKCFMTVNELIGDEL